MSDPVATESHTVTMHLDFDDEVELSKAKQQESKAKQPEIVSTFARSDEDGQIDESQKIKFPIHLTFHHIRKVLTSASTGAAPTTTFQFGSVSRPKEADAGERVLLNNISGEVRPGQIMAVMGPSGGGKTTLLSCICGRSPGGLTGDVCLNGERWRKEFKRKTAYIAQNDLFHDFLTVKEQLTFTALLRLPKHMTRAEKLAQVDRVIEQLGMKKCENTPILFVSGGEKKRVNIATELLTDPSLIILDEPTSGLDSTSAVSLMKTLRSLAQQGRTIIMSIHQPSSQVFQSFDSLLLLADGNIVFYGKPTDAITHFSHFGYHCPAQYNPADYIMDLVGADANVRKRLIEEYTKKPTRTIRRANSDASAENASDDVIIIPAVAEKSAVADDTLDEPKWPSSWMEQFTVLLERARKKAWGEIFTRLNIYQTFSLAIICGLLWFQRGFKEKDIQDRSSFVFFVMIYWPMNTMFSSLMSFPKERIIMEKERASGAYRLSSYFIAKTVAETPLRLVLPTVFLIIAYWMAGINNGFQYFLGVLCAELLCVIAAESLGLFLGAAIIDLMQAIVLASVAMLSFMLVGGFYIQNLPYWLKWLKYCSIFKYAFDSCLRFQFMGDYVYYCDGSNIINSCKSGATTFGGEEVIDFLGVQGSVGFNLGILVAILFMFRIGAYLALRYKKPFMGR